MPISENIKKEITGLSLSEDEKKLLFDFLALEDCGIHRYQDAYRKLIKEYLEEHTEEVGEK